MPFTDPSVRLQLQLPSLSGVLPKLREDLDAAVALLDSFPIRVDYLRSATPDSDVRFQVSRPYDYAASTLEAYGKKTKNAELRELADWLSNTSKLLCAAHETQEAWLREPATPSQLAALGDAIPFELPLEVSTLLRISNGLAQGVVPDKRRDFLFADVDTLAREFRFLVDNSGATNYLPAFTSNGNHILIKLDEVDEVRKASLALGTKGKPRPVRRHDAILFDHEEGLAAARAFSSAAQLYTRFAPALWEG